MKAFDEMSKTDEEDEKKNEKKDEVIEGLTATDVLVNCVGICLESELKSQFESTRPEKGEDGWLSDEYREYLEDTIEMPTIYKVLEVCADMKLNDPQLLRAAAEAAAGTN